MKREPLNSSMLASAGYDEDAGVLEVEFASGEVYRYFDVPADVYAGLLDAESKGKYMTIDVLPVYRYQRVRR